MEFGKINVENICKENDEQIERVRKIMDEKNIPFSEAVMLVFKELINNDLRKLFCNNYGRDFGKTILNVPENILGLNTGLSDEQHYFITPEHSVKHPGTTRPIPADEINPDRTYTIECGSRSWLVPGAVLIELEKHFG